MAMLDGIALEIVFDNSGSMKDKVRDAGNRPEEKHRIASRALQQVVSRLEAFQRSPDGRDLPIESGLVVFSGRNAVEPIEFASFAPLRYKEWIQRFHEPREATPLGEATALAGKRVLGSRLARKHILVITDGASNRGRKPADVLRGLKDQAAKAQTSVLVHFVAFDVDSKVFADVKELGATVVAAMDEKELNAQLSFILENQILLEAGPPAPSQPTNNQKR